MSDTRNRRPRPLTSLLLPLVAAPALASILAAPAAATTCAGSVIDGPRRLVDEIRLRDGRVLFGDVQQRGDRITIETREGKVVVGSDEVLSRRTDQELRDELRDLSRRYGNAPHAALELARLAQRYCLEDLLWSYLDHAVTEIPATGALRRRLDAFLATLEPDLLPAHRCRAIPERKIEELLARVRPDTSPGRVAAVEAILATQQAEDVTELLAGHARSASRAQQRQSALRALLAREGEEAAPFVWRTAVVDPSPQLRREVIDWARAIEATPAAVAAIAPGLQHAHPKVLARSAAALGALGDAAAIAPLVAAGPRAAAASLPGGSTRAHAAFLQQQAYVRDFDVEVAQASFIADPQIDVLQSGTVLDVTVHSVTTVRTELVRVVRGALRDISGRDPGADVASWSDWMKSLPTTESVTATGTLDTGGK